MSIADIFRKSLKKKWYIKINTRHPDGDSYCGVVIRETKSFVAIAEFSELEYDGVAIIAKKYIRSLRDSKSEKCINEILRMNGQIRKVKKLKWLESCEKISCIVEKMMKRDIWPGVETISSNKKDSAFFVGPIVGFNDKYFGTYCYSGDGKWEQEYILPFSGVLRFTLDDSYTKHFNRYMRKKTKVLPWE